MACAHKCVMSLAVNRRARRILRHPAPDSRDARRGDVTGVLAASLHSTMGTTAPKYELLIPRLTDEMSEAGAGYILSLKAHR